MAEQGSFDQVHDEEELNWLFKFAKILLAEVPQGFKQFEKLSRDAFTNTISKDDYVKRMEKFLLIFPQLKLAIKKVILQGRTYRLSVSKDLLEEWSDWKRRWAAETDVENPTVYESHLFRCFLTIKAEINLMATEDYVMIMDARFAINCKEARELEALRLAPTFPHPISPIHPPIDDNAITKYFKSVKEIGKDYDAPGEGLYNKFKDILVAHAKNLDYRIGDSLRTMKLSKVGVCQELCELFRDHKEILSNFIQFLPHIVHISRNVAKYDVTE